ncbi:uncharacterized protein BT62DRAFT_538444 [Guyanagaster necrorhizus]|uniref:Uncharacterized protein n=1 Tax=Guyanagaster necrorhizus TaxID=856835 RepID=A0A9P7W1G6_9AGAR|nr:uncharacterized protein BT62DRAFT_538444 [Guyanagaster necrorhizus MCA 3950]KAG7450834.1 hypothetical protein BT62DRAFT_538444 [Guyanagaster necrorhizus MCA 3950]
MPRPLPSHRFTYLSNTLRHSKAQYEYIADSHRASVCLTNNARKRAARLHLAVDIIKARQCQQSFVSKIPLPHIDDSICLDSSVVHAASEVFYPQVHERLPPIVIPAPNDRRRSLSPDLELVSRFSAWSDADVPHTASSGPFCSSSASSASLMTPDHDHPPIIVRIKRKSMLDEGSDYEASEKRPRYLRKDWSSRRI